MSPSSNLKKYGRLLAVFPLLMAATVTVPRLYLELKGADVFGNRHILQGEVIGKYRVDPFLDKPERCYLQVKIGESVEHDPVDCETWPSFEVGDVQSRIDAWTTFVSPEEIWSHIAIDSSILFITVCVIFFLLNIRRFVEWVEKQVNQSAPIIAKAKERP